MKISTSLESPMVPPIPIAMKITPSTPSTFIIVSWRRAAKIKKFDASLSESLSGKRSRMVSIKSRCFPE